VRIRTIITTAALSTALVAGSMAGPALAADVAVQPVIALSAPSVSVKANGTAPLAININQGGSTTFLRGYVIGKNGVPVLGASIQQDDLGNATVDVIDQISAGLYQYGDVPAGTYSFYVASEQGSRYDSASDTRTTYLPAQSAVIPVKISKTKTKITGWKTKSKSARYGKLINTSNPTIRNYNSGADIVLQYKTSKKGKWKTSEVGQGYGNTTTAKFKLTTSPFNTIKNRSKPVKRGTYYFRVKIKATPYSTGAVTKQIKLTWK